MSKRVQFLLTALLVAVLMVSACGGRNAEEAAPPAEEPAQVLEEAAEPTEAPAEEEAVEEEAAEEEAAPTEEPAEEEAAEEEAAEEEAGGESDVVVATVNEYLSNIPEGWMSVGNAEKMQEAMDNGAFVIDVREEGEYAEGHIPGAVNIPLRTLAQNVDQIPTDRQIITYCASGHRAGMALSALQTLGYDTAKGFPGSWKAWTEAEGEVSMEAVEGETYEVPEIDPEVAAAVDGFLSTIPEGWLAVGSVEAVQEAVDNGAFLVDLREPSEYEEGYILDAVNIPLRTVAQSLDQIPTDAPVIVYCGSGWRAALGLSSMQTMGLTNVKSFPGSWNAWSAAQEAAEGEGDAAVEEEAEEEVPAEVEEAMDSDFDAVAAVGAYLSEIPEGWMSVGNAEAMTEMLENAAPYLIDVRTAAEYDEGHIPGAVNIPLRTLADNLDQIPTDENVVVYCASGHRAGMATSILRSLGYDNVKAFPGGWNAWSAAEGEVETEANEPGTFEMADVNPEMVAASAEFLNNIPEGFYAVGDIEAFKGAMDAGATVIDVRQPDEFEAGRIPGAINIPLRELGDNVDQIPTDEPVFVYCQSGWRAALATGALHNMGYENVRSFPPSFAGWEAAGEEIEQ